MESLSGAQVEVLIRAAINNIKLVQKDTGDKYTNVPFL
jgi:hypothetical protein